MALDENEELAPMLQRLAAADGARAQVLVFPQDFHALCRRPEWATLSVEVVAESARNSALAEAFAAHRRQLQHVLVNFRLAMAVPAESTGWLAGFFHLPEGQASASSVTLAGWAWCWPRGQRGCGPGGSRGGSWKR